MSLRNFGIPLTDTTVAQQVFPLEGVPLRGTLHDLEAERASVGGGSDALTFNIFDKDPGPVPVTLGGIHDKGQLALGGGAANGSATLDKHYDLTDDIGSPSTTLYDISGQPNDGDTLIIESLTFTFVTALTDPAEQNNRKVVIGIDEDATYAALVAAVNALNLNVTASYSTGSNVLSFQPVGFGVEGSEDGFDQANVDQFAADTLDTTTVNNLDPAVPPSTKGRGGQARLYLVMSGAAGANDVRVQVQVDDQEPGI